ncbi:MAG: CHAD domain-containing protein, partial [Armatimonadota bacterium]|nr:CHAD domain-containing protein [Armatimonadota bacterium]
MAKIAQEAGVDADAPLLVGASKLFVYLWDEAWKNAPGTLEGDVEALHDMRVAMRRLRVVLQNFEGPKADLLVPRHLRRELAEQRKQVGKLGDALGAVRDFDVLQEDLDGYIKKKSRRANAAFPGLELLCQHLQAERAALFPKMVKGIKRGLEPRGLREQFGRFALGVPAVDMQPLLLRGAAQLIVPRRVEEVLAGAHTLEKPEDALGHHEWRKTLRRLRYTLETLAPCFPESVESHIECLIQLQDYLGEMQDLYVLRGAIFEAFPQAKTDQADDGSSPADEP